ncbi:PREDICTED: metal-nicotianamine transporter YSL3 isoform X1 [Tarenaya hassleriana]|uniref:metal-nicotianamine transporter YSL3 isoform X1 n=1 Tax=Tarenaya hassleriana TaxID=28532 RepID=UPI00053C2914|nr:PREDICTED: metal-nicotianamine transporter YSL3 isoform X1 [Tarenaya hassleriana]
MRNSTMGREDVNEIEKKEERDDLEETQNEPDDLKTIPPWKSQLTFRGIIASLFIGVIYSVIVMKLNLTTGLVPNLNVSAALLAFVFLKTWTTLLHKAGIVTKPFTKQENTLVQTCAVACYSIAVGGGFGSYLLGLNQKTYEQSGGIDTVGNNPGSTKEPGIGWMTGFLFVTCFVGLLALVPLRKIMIIDYKLTYPSGTATAVLINGFHTSKGNKMARKQVRGFAKYFSVSFIWAFFQWFFSGDGSESECGFVKFPTFGLLARKNSFYFDFSMTYIGAGMICSHLVNLSLLLGAVLSWGIMWPIISGLEGKWYPESLPKSSMKSLNGYKVFVSIALILGDGLYNFVKILVFTGWNIYSKMKNHNAVNSGTADSDNHKKTVADLKRDEVFVRDSIPLWVAVVSYGAFSVVSVVLIPMMFHEVKWYFVVVAYVLAPSLSFSNAYGAGLTDMNMAYNYGKVALFILAAMAGKQDGVVAGLVGCGLIKSIVSISSDLMHDFKTGHLTFTSPRSMLVSQAIGTAIGCVVAPLTFFLFYKAFDVGNPNGTYKAPYALVYRNMAILGVEGFSALPRHCLELCYGFFAFAVAANLARDMLPENVGKWVPLPMAMAVPFLVGGYFAIDMCVGSLVVFVWNRIDKTKARLMIPAIASGLICGDGLWILPSSILALAGVYPPICMSFMPSSR